VVYCAERPTLFLFSYVCVAVCCSVLQCVAVYCRVFRSIGYDSKRCLIRKKEEEGGAGWCSVLHGVAVFCSVL